VAEIPRLRLEPLHDVLRGGPLLIGHRGAAGLVPENTMASFRDAVDRWAVDMIELDVRASADGHCVVIHDATVDRTTDGTGSVADLTLAELRELDAGYRFQDENRASIPFRGQGLGIPTIEEVLEELPRHAAHRGGQDRHGPGAPVRRAGAVQRRGPRRGGGDGHRDRTLFGDLCGRPQRVDPRRPPVLPPPSPLRGPLWRRSCEVFQVPERHGWLRLVTRRFIRDASPATGSPSTSGP
jgi:hypothetical protein